jgi:hypothetical protein
MQMIRVTRKIPSVRLFMREEKNILTCDMTRARPSEGMIGVGDRDSYEVWLIICRGSLKLAC